MFYVVGYWHLFDYTKAFPGYYNIVTCRLTVIVLGLFMLISGYLLGERDIYYDRKETIAFYKKRLLRIYPPFIFAIVLFYVLGISNGPTLLKSAALMSMFFPPAPPTLWFVTAIVIFYIIAPLLINFTNKVTIINYAIICALVTAVMFFIMRTSAEIRLLIYFPSFASGVLLSRHKDLLYKVNIWVISLLVIVCYVISLNRRFPFHEKHLSSMPMALVGSLLIFVFIMRIDKKLIRSRGIALLSYAGLFMYLFHRPIYKIILHLYFPESGAYQVIYLLAICFPAVLAISWLGQRAYDQFILQVTRR